MTPQKYILVLIFMIIVHRLKVKNPTMYHKIEQLGPIIYPGPIVNHIEQMFSTFLYQARNIFA